MSRFSKQSLRTSQLRKTLAAARKDGRIERPVPNLPPKRIRRLEESEKIEIAEQYAAGASTRELTKQHHLSRSTIAGIVTGAGHRVRPHGHSEKVRAKILSLHAEGLEVKEICRATSISETTVRRIIRLTLHQ